MKINRRNALEGKIIKLIKRPLSTETGLRVAKAVEIVASVTTTSAKRLGLKKDEQAYGAIKANSVMVASG